MIIFLKTGNGTSDVFLANNPSKIASGYHEPADGLRLERHV
jgi:hypothetical protein